MRSLIVDDDFFCRRILQAILSQYGECDIAVDGKEAIIAFEQSLFENKPYDLICLDIMMPELSGQDALLQIRNMELDNGVPEENKVKVIMTTALDDCENIRKAFHAKCESYLIKPISKAKLVK